MIATDVDQEQLLIRKVAEVELSQSLGAQGRLLDENSATFRWLLASLLAVNGGGALGLLSSTAIHRIGVVVAGGAFSIGVFCALLLAYFTQKSAERMIQPMGEIAGFWIATLQSGEFDAEIFSKRRQAMLDALKPTKRASYVVGWASAVCFVVGVVTIGLNLK